jgi:hypothetical protein
MATIDREAAVQVKELSQAESFAVLDDAARHYLGMSGEDFVRAWDAGEFGADADRP